MNRNKKTKYFIPPQDDPIPLTQSALNEKRAEFARLKKRRAEVMVRLVEAREKGDLSENGAYTAAKFELGDLGRRLRYIRYVLKNAYVPVEFGGNTVEFGVNVTLLNTQTKKENTYILVSQHESDPLNGKLSLESPIGSAIRGKMAGDVVEVETPRGVVEFVINAIG